MRLYLSSFRMGDDFDRLIRAVPAGAAVGVISNALDFFPREDRIAYARTVFDPVEHFRRHGLDAQELDLRAYFGRMDLLRTDTEHLRLVWANGGNAFLLRRAMRQSGMDELLKQRVRSGDTIYGGWSAGAVVAGPTLRGLELMDDPWVLADGYIREPVWEGLSLIDFSIVPHFESAHPEAHAAARALAWLTENDLPVRPLRDGEAFIE